MEILKPESNTDVRLFPTAGKDGEEEETSDDYSFTVVHSESKARSDAVNLEPAVVIEPEPGEAEHDGDLDALDMNSEEHDSVDQDALPYPLAFLAVESKSEDGMWEPAANVKVESDAQNEDFGVRLEELGEVSKEAWKGIKSKTRPYVVEAERRETQKAQSRLNKKKCRASKPEEELKKIREKDRLRKRMALASQTAEDAARRREKDRLRKRRATEVRQQQMRSCLAQLGMCSSKSQHTGASELDLIKQSELWGSVALFADLARQREQSRLRKQKYLASQSPEEVQKRREKDRLRKRKMLSCQTVEEVELRRARDRQRKRRLKQLEEKLEQQLVQQTDLERSTAILLELQQFERRRERNRLSKRRALASQTAQQVERRRERDRLRKRRVRLRDTAQESDCSVKDQT
ncbi:uncharacterized protein [Periplaneta americana]|uniref:uncharacterized protein isoform X2 n=1 Tax=Periplaneta americana TaxID=6978 RepID=UPI0037E85E8F